MSEQQDNIRRVSHRIGWAVLAFRDLRVATGREEFFAAELREFVMEQVGHPLAPASPDRILRELRLKGLLNYEVISRSKSFYRFIPLEPPPDMVPEPPPDPHRPDHRFDQLELI
jgi:hypothetical protein